MNNKELYEQAFKDFIPASDDSPDNIPFYRAWNALKALLNAYGYEDPYSAPINAHGICCWSKEGIYEDFVKVLPMHTPKEPVKDSRIRCFYRHEPSLPTEKDARLIFEVSYKNKFVGKRLNSKHAKEQWEKVKVQAMSLAQDDYNEKKKEYDLALAKHDAQEAKEESEYQEKLNQYHKTIELIAKLSC